jgi:hypothetical protein
MSLNRYIIVDHKNINWIVFRCCDVVMFNLNNGGFQESLILIMQYFYRHEREIYKRKGRISYKNIRKRTVIIFNIIC